MTPPPDLLDTLGLSAYENLQEAFTLLALDTASIPRPVFQVLGQTDELAANVQLQRIKTDGYFLAIKQCQAYWHEELGVLISGKAAESVKQETLSVLKACWVMQCVARQVDWKLDQLLSQTQKTMRFERNVNPQALGQLPAISRTLYEMRLLDLLISDPRINGAAIMRQSTALRLLFNELSDEELEIADYYDLVWERVEQSLDYYEGWQEKLIEYRSFFYEAILEVAIILLLVLSFVVKSPG